MITGTDTAGCCAPLACEPIAATDAAEPAGAFKAVGDPVRGPLLSLIASHAGGEVCVCDLTPARADRPDDLPPPEGAAQPD